MEEKYFHVYQRSIDGGVVFYTTEDCLLFYTILSLISAKYKIVVLAVAIMPNHIHLLIRVKNIVALRRFVSAYTSRFTVLYNEVYGREGHLFSAPFGKSEKYGTKRIRTCLSYIYNNPVEKKISSSVESSIWNFLSYARSPFPFSPKLVIRNASWQMRKAIKECRYMLSSRQPIQPVFLARLFKKLIPNEQNQLRDYIIGLYRFIRHDKAYSFYGSYETMVLAANSNTGSEYEIEEEFYKGSDAVYADMTSELMKTGLVDFPAKVANLSIEVKRRLLWDLRLKTTATDSQIARFLHLPREM